MALLLAVILLAVILLEVMLSEVGEGVIRLVPVPVPVLVLGKGGDESLSLEKK